MPADGMHVAIEPSRGTSARPTDNSENHYIASEPSTHQPRRNLSAPLTTGSGDAPWAGAVIEIATAGTADVSRIE